MLRHTLKTGVATAVLLTLAPAAFSQELVIGLRAGPDSIDPHWSTLGSQAEALWVICEGTISIQLDSGDEPPAVIQTLCEPELLGWSALVGDGLMSATALTTTETTLLRLPADALKDLCIADHTLGYAVMGTIAATLNSRLAIARQQAARQTTSTGEQPHAARLC